MLHCGAIFTLWRQVIDLVLATDMKQHWNIIAHFNLKHRVATAPSNNTSTDKGQLGPMLAAGAVGSTATAYASAVGEDAAAAGEVVPNDDVERLLGLQVGPGGVGVALLSPASAVRCVAACVCTSSFVPASLPASNVRLLTTAPACLPPLSRSPPPPSAPRRWPSSAPTWAT